MWYGKKEVDGVNIFYRETGQLGKPMLVLFHGFPSAGHPYRCQTPGAHFGHYQPEWKRVSGGARQKVGKSSPILF